MGRERWVGTLVVAVVLLLMGCLRDLLPEPGIPRITKEEAKSMMGDSNIVILDVREPDDWNKSKEKIVGAMREDPEKDIKTWIGNYSKDKTFIFY